MINPRAHAAFAAAAAAGPPRISLNDAVPQLPPLRAPAQAGRGSLRLEREDGAGGKLRYLGRPRNKLWFKLTAASHNLTRLARSRRPPRSPTARIRPQRPTRAQDFILDLQDQRYDPR